MSELAFDKEGNPFRFSRRTYKLRPRRWKTAGQRGTCAAVLDAEGEQVWIDADAEYVEFRNAVGNVPGFYRLDQCDEDGTPIEDTPPAYVSIESTRNTASLGDADHRDALIRDLAQINADIARTITERFSNVMQAAADLLRAADGAGLSRRTPPLPPAPPEKEEDEDEDEDDEDDENEDETAEPGPSAKIWEFVADTLPDIRLWLDTMAAKRSAQQSSPAVPSATPAAAAPSAPEHAPSSTMPPAYASTAAPAPASAAPPPAPATANPTAPTASRSSMPVADAPSGTSLPADAAQPVAPRNATGSLEPTDEQWGHFFAVRALLSPREAAITETSSSECRLRCARSGSLSCPRSASIRPSSMCAL